MKKAVLHELGSMLSYFLHLTVFELALNISTCQMTEESFICEYDVQIQTHFLLEIFLP